MRILWFFLVLLIIFLATVDIWVNPEGWWIVLPAFIGVILFLCKATEPRVIIGIEYHEILRRDPNYHYLSRWL